MNALVLIFSLFSRFACSIKNLFYDLRLLQPARAPLPVISVGSIALGGTEKTPLAIEILDWLLKKGNRPALVSRGYKGKWEKQGGVVSNGKIILATWKEAGDEPFMAAQAIPKAGVFVGKNRLASCRRAVDLGFDIAVLDDGFQHRRLGRDLDIVLSPPPQTISLREPRSSMKRADLILVKSIPPMHGPNPTPRSSPAPKKIFFYTVAPGGFFQIFARKPIPPEELTQKKLFAFCGIARPERFLSLLCAAGMRVVSFLLFPDHHPYPDSSLEKIIKKLKTTGAEAAITTEKDAVKILDRPHLFGNIPVYYSKICVHVELEFFASLASFLENKFTGHIT